MDVIVYLIIFSLFVALTFLALFFWAVKTGQFDDPQTPSMRMLFEDEIISDKNKTLTNKTD